MDIITIIIIIIALHCLVRHDMAWHDGVLTDSDSPAPSVLDVLNEFMMPGLMPSGIHSLIRPLIHRMAAINSIIRSHFIDRRHRYWQMVALTLPLRL